MAEQSTPGGRSGNCTQRDDMRGLAPGDLRRKVGGVAFENFHVFLTDIVTSRESASTCSRRRSNKPRGRPLCVHRMRSAGNPQFPWTARHISRMAAILSTNDDDSCRASVLAMLHDF